MLLFIEKNMTNITYEEFIQNILNTRGRFSCGDEYCERHHIVPKCMNGTDDENNLIDLFAKEHFIAHKLLAQENPENYKLMYAWWMLAHIDDREITPEEYKEARIAFSYKMKTRTFSEEHRRKIGEANKGRQYTDEWRRKQSELHKGKPGPNKGKPMSDETKQKQSEAHKNPSKETRKKMSDAKIGTTPWNKNKKMSKDFCKKNSESHKGLQVGENNPRARKVIRLYDKTTYGTIDECVYKNNMTRKMIYSRCKKKKDFMYYDEWLFLNNACGG